MTPNRSINFVAVFRLLLIAISVVAVSCSTSRFLTESTVTIHSTRNVDNRGLSCIVGVVYDSTGYDMGGTNIDLINATTQVSEKHTIAQIGNTFSVAGIHPGKYTIVASFIGFSKAKSTILEIKANTTILVDIYLNPEPIHVLD